MAASQQAGVGAVSDSDDELYYVQGLQVWLSKPKVE